MYFGGYNRCGKGSRVWRTFEGFHQQTNKVMFSGRIWTIDSWDSETFTVKIMNEAGGVLAEKTWTGNNFQKKGTVTTNCPATPGWADGFFNVELEAPYKATDGKVTVEITTTIDQGANDESLGWSELEFSYEFDANQQPTPTPV